MSPLQQQVLNVNQYRLVKSPADYVAAIEALAARTEAEGHRGVLRYQFYVDAVTETAGAVIVYADATAWLDHHHLAYQWPEMAALQSTVRLEGLTLFGPLTDDVVAWIEGAGLEYTHYPEPAAGFVRDTA